MKALQLQAVGQLRLVDIPRPEPAEDQLLIRTGAAVICTSDINDIRENPFHIPLPVILGHEGAGTVFAIGRAVRGFNLGDRVAAHPVHPCGTCANCRGGLGHLCLQMGHFGLNMQGVFAEYFVVRADRARVVSPSTPFVLAALAEPVCVCLEALDQSRLQSGQSLLVIGDGPFGVLMARLAASWGLRRVVVAGRHDYRLQFAGQAIKINLKMQTDSLSALRAPVDGGGYDAVILAVGNPQAVRDGMALLKAKGRLVVFSAIPREMPVNLFDVHVKELEILGACNDNDKLDSAISRLADPALDLGRLITNTFPLESWSQAFDLAARGREEAMKVAFTFEGDGR